MCIVHFSASNENEDSSSKSCQKDEGSFVVLIW